MQSKSDPDAIESPDGGYDVTHKRTASSALRWGHYDAGKLEGSEGLKNLGSSINRSVALASALKLIKRITTFTTSRSHSIHCASSQSRSFCTPIPTSRRSGRRINKAYSVRHRSVVSLLNDLLPDKQEKPAAKPNTIQRRSSETAHAEFVPTFKRYTLPERPHCSNDRIKDLDLERINLERQVIVSYDESISRQLTGPPTSISEIASTQTQLLHLYKKFRSLNYRRPDPMHSHVQILTTPTADTPGTTLLLHFDNKRYIVGNLSEGTQRAGVQTGARFLKASEVFLTGRSEWSNTGGLIGMILTLADSVASSQGASKEDALKKAHAKARRLNVSHDAQKMQELQEEALKDISEPTLTIYGPPNLNHTLATARRFVFRKGMPINIHEIQEERYTASEDQDEWAPYYADENIKVWAMSISPKTPSRPTTPRKRSIHEVYGRETKTNVTTNGDSPSGDKDKVTAKFVVNEMFASTWAKDTLYETPLNQVKLPAALFIRNPYTNKIERYNGPLPGGEEPLDDPTIKVLVRRPWPGALVKSLPKTEPSKEAISYIFRNHRQRGKFKPVIAKDLNVAKGQKWSELAAGNTVLNEDGIEIKPEMVLGPDKVGGGFAVVDLPNPDYIEPLINRPEWYEEKVMLGVGAIIWTCGKGVATDLRLHAFMQKFSNLSHIVSSAECCPNELAFDSVAASTARLRKVDPARYKVPVHELQGIGGEYFHNGGESFQTVQQRKSLLVDGVHIAKRGQMLQLEPSIELQDKQTIAPLDISNVESQVPQEVLIEAALAQDKIQTCSDEDLAWIQTLPDPETEIITLGTGSALPSKYRNVSATLVKVPGWGCMLLDCGENTLGQLKRVFTQDELKQVLQELRLIFISHMHADHHLGTVGVIKAWYEEVYGCQPGPALSATANKREAMSETERRLSVISEPAMMHWLAEYAEVEDYGFSRIAPLVISPAFPDRKQRSQLNWLYVPDESLSNAELEERTDANHIRPSALGIADIQAVLVKHCHGARAVSITLPSGFKVSYSGDCRPSKAFTQIGKGSTVCIHEATFDDELHGDAEAKNHSTTSEALGVAQGMRSKACVLTHFSQRYQKLPVLERGSANAAEEDVEVEAPQEDDEPKDAEFETSGPMEDDMAPTMPDQTAAEDVASASEGQKYELPSKGKNSDAAAPSASAGPPSAVNFKLRSDMKVCVAFDYMRVKVKDMWQMEKFTPALLKLFAEEDKTEKEVKIEEAGDGKKPSKREQKKIEKKRSRGFSDAKASDKKEANGSI